MQKHLILTLCLSLIGISSVYSQSRFDEVQIKPHQIKDNIYMLEGSGGNIGLFVGQEEVLIIDSQFAPLSGKIKSAISKISDLPIKWLVNTHWHGDHTGGNENFANDGTILIGHKNVLDRLSRENVRGDQVTPPAPEKARSDIAFNDQLTLNLSGDQVYVHHVENAHTDGDAFVFFPKENVLHMGDCFFNGRFPYIDLSSGGSSKGYLMAISGALMMVDDDTVIIPGHGDLADKNSLNTFHDMLSTLITRMENALKSANTLEEIDVAQITSGYDGWGSGFINNERIAQILFEDLSK